MKVISNPHHVTDLYKYNWFSQENEEGAFIDFRFWIIYGKISRWKKNCGEYLGKMIMVEVVVCL